MKTVFKALKDSKELSMDRCILGGKAEISGTGHKITNTSIGVVFKNIPKEYPILYGIISAVLGGLITLIVEYQFFIKS